MADIGNGTQFSDLPSCLAIDILSRLPLKALLICSRCVCRDWIRSYFSDPYFIRLQLETSKTLILSITEEGRNFQFESIGNEVSTGNLRIQTLELPCNKFLHDHRHYRLLANSCNGLLCFMAKSFETAESSVYVCNPILDEWVSIRVPYRIDFLHSRCALGFSDKDNQYKILLCAKVRGIDTPGEYEWKIYTLGTGHWRSIETKETIDPSGPDFNTFIHGSLHWTSYGDVAFVHSFNFETERFTVFSLPELKSDRIKNTGVTLGVINGCLWASFYNTEIDGEGEMWAMKEYGVDKPWTMMVAFRYDCRGRYAARNKELAIFKEPIGNHSLLFTLNGEILTWHWRCVHGFVCYNLKTMRRRAVRGQSAYMACRIAYNPSFVSLYDVGEGERVVRDDQEVTKEEEQEETKECGGVLM